MLATSLYLAYNLSESKNNLESGTETLAAVLPFFITPLLGVVAGFILEKFG